MLCSLIYFSERSFACPDVEVVRIVEEAAERNKKRGLTGFLVADTRFFLQALEGDRKTLSTLLDVIQADLRHSDVVIASFMEIEKREFPDWGMAHVGDPALIKIAAAPIVGDGPLAPEKLTSDQLRQLIVRTKTAAH
jgi:sugar/nucleoside kinase (ribokinase family)